MSELRNKCLRVSPVHRKPRDSSVQTGVSQSSPPLSPSGTSGECRSTALITATGHTQIQFINTSLVFSYQSTDNQTKYLEISSLLEDSYHRFVDLCDELVPLRLPEVIHTHLQLLHQCVLQDREVTQHIINTRSSEKCGEILHLCVRSVLSAGVLLHRSLFFHIRRDVHEGGPAHTE